MVHDESVQTGEQAVASAADMSTEADGVAGPARDGPVELLEQLAVDVQERTAALEDHRVGGAAVDMHMVHGREVDDHPPGVEGDEVLVAVAAAANRDSPAGVHRALNRRDHLVRIPHEVYAIRRADEPLVGPDHQGVVSRIVRPDDDSRRVGDSGELRGIGPMGRRAPGAAESRDRDGSGGGALQKAPARHPPGGAATLLDPHGQRYPCATSAATCSTFDASTMAGPVRKWFAGCSP